MKLCLNKVDAQFNEFNNEKVDYDKCINKCEGYDVSCKDYEPIKG